MVGGAAFAKVIDGVEPEFGGQIQSVQNRRSVLRHRSLFPRHQPAAGPVEQFHGLRHRYEHAAVFRCPAAGTLLAIRFSLTGPACSEPSVVTAVFKSCPDGRPQCVRW